MDFKIYETDWHSVGMEHKDDHKNSLFFEYEELDEIIETLVIIRDGYNERKNSEDPA